MNRPFLTLIGTVATFTFLSKLLYVYLDGGYAVFSIFILNVIMILLFNGFFNKKPVVEDANYEYDYNAKSITIFIKLVTYCMPIILLIGLYFVSMNGVLNLDSANNWVSFILAIVAFALSLISIYQSESTFKKMLDHLTDIKASSIKTEEAINASRNKPVINPNISAIIQQDSGSITTSGGSDLKVNR